MKLTTRLTKFFAADAHAVLDSMEDPLSQLKQALRDMELSIDQQKRALEQLINNDKHLSNQFEVLNKQYAEADRDLDVCFESSNEELARTIVKKKLYIDQRVEQLKQSQVNLKEKQARLAQQLQSNQEQYLLIEQQAAVYVAKQQEEVTTRNSFDSGYSSNQVINDDDVEMAFLNEKRKRANS